MVQLFHIIVKINNNVEEEEKENPNLFRACNVLTALSTLSRWGLVPVKPGLLLFPF